jgi:hypothetical protein
MGEWMYKTMFSWPRHYLEVSGQLHALAALSPRKNTHWIWGWVGPRAGMDDMEKWKFLPPSGSEIRPLGRPSHSQSLYRLSYPGSFISVSYRYAVFTYESTSIFVIKRRTHFRNSLYLIHGKMMAHSWNWVANDRPLRTQIQNEWTSLI